MVGGSRATLATGLDTVAGGVVVVEVRGLIAQADR